MPLSSKGTFQGTLGPLPYSQAPTLILESDFNSPQNPSFLGEKKEEESGNKYNNKDKQNGAASILEEQYPTGPRLGFIVLALVLSIFLVSLDMVSLYHGGSIRTVR